MVLCQRNPTELSYERETNKNCMSFSCLDSSRNIIFLMFIVTLIQTEQIAR